MAEMKEPRIIYPQLKSTIDELIDHLKRGQCIHASAQLFPIAKVNDDGKDEVFKDTENVNLEQHYGQDAMNCYFDMLRPQSKQLGKSSLSARRLSGIIHISGSDDWLCRAYKLLDAVHKLKQDFLNSLTTQTKTRYARQQLLRTFAPELLPLTAYRQFPYVRHDNPIDKVYFSWVTQGQTYEELIKKEVIHRIQLRNRHKVKFGCELSEDRLNEIDIASLGNKELFTLIRPSKIYPTMQTLDLHQTISQPIKLALPILLLQSNPLSDYSALPNFKLNKDKIKKMAKRTRLIAVIEEYGIFCKP